MAYTVNMYTTSTGPRKDQPTFNLRIKYAVVLYEPVVEVTADDD